MPTATAEVETTPKPLAPSGARQRLQEVAGAMDEFFQSDDWKTADSPTRQQHLDRITGVFDEEYSRAAPDLNPDEADQLFNSGVSFLKGRLAESGDAPPLDAFPSEGAMKAADALRQTRNDANAPEPNAEDYGTYGLQAIQLKRSSAQERYPKERLDFIKKTGLRPEHVDRLMDDREALERLKDNAVVMKTTGDVAVPPQKAMDEAEWNSAVDATNATPEKKAKAKAHRLKVRDQLAGKIEFSLAAVDPEWEKWSAAMAGEMKDASIGEKVERFIKWRKASGAKMSAIDRAVDQNAASFVKQFFGLIGGITNIGMMKEAAATAGEIEQANAQIRSVMGGAGATGFAVDLLGGLAPTIAFSPLARLATTNLGAMRLMAGIGAAQGYGGKYADASAAYSEQGLSDRDAHMKAQLPALVSALTTYALARMMPRGVESIGQISSAKAAAKTAYRKWAGELLADVGDEALEEAFQAVSDEITAKFTYDPKKDMRSALENIFMSGLMGGIGGGVVGAVSRYANKVKPLLETAEQMRKDGYPLAAAETEKTAEIEATKQYWADVAKAQKRAVERAQSDAGLVSAEGAKDAKSELYNVFGNVQRKAGEPKNEDQGKGLQTLPKEPESVRLRQEEVAEAAQPYEPSVTAEHFSDSGKFYRVVVGDEAFTDIVNSGVVRTNAGEKAAGGTLAERMAARPTAFPSFSAGSASMSYAAANPNHYIVVTDDASIQPSKQGRHGKGTTMFPTDSEGNPTRSLSGKKVQVYKHTGDGNYELVYADGRAVTSPAAKQSAAPSPEPATPAAASHAQTAKEWESANKRKLPQNRAPIPESLSLPVGTVVRAKNYGENEGDIVITGPLQVTTNGIIEYPADFTGSGRMAAVEANEITEIKPAAAKPVELTHKQASAMVDKIQQGEAFQKAEETVRSIVGGKAQTKGVAAAAGGEYVAAAGDMYYAHDGGFTFIDAEHVLKFDKDGNLLRDQSEIPDRQAQAVKAKENEIARLRESITEVESRPVKTTRMVRDDISGEMVEVPLAQATIDRANENKKQFLSKARTRLAELTGQPASAPTQPAAAPAAEQPAPAPIEQAIADANWRGTVREAPAPRSMGGEGVKLYIPVDASGKDVSVGGQTILGKTPAEAIELAQKNAKPAPAPVAAPAKGRADADSTWLEALMGSGSEAVATPQAVQSFKPLKPIIDTLRSDLEKQAEDWDSRKYKPNKTQVELRGDGPGKRDSISIGSINEGRRQKALDAIGGQIRAIDNLSDAISTPEGEAALDSAIKRTWDEAGKTFQNSRFKNQGDLFESLLIEDVLKLKPARGAYDSLPLSKAIRARMEAESTPSSTAPSATPQAEGGIFGYAWADIRSKQQGGKLAALIRGNAPKATESDFAVLEKHGMDWLYENKKHSIIDRLGLPVDKPSKKAEVKPKPPAQSFTEKVRAKIVPGAKVSVQLVRGAKLAHPAVVGDVFLDSNGKPESVSVTFDGGGNIKKGRTQTVPFGNVSLRPGVESRMLTNEQFEGMTKEEAQKTRAAAKEFKKLVIEYPELGFYSGHLEAVAAGPQGEAAIKKARADAYVKAMTALGVHPDKADARDAVTQASLVEKLRELTKKPGMERKQYADFQEAKEEGDGEIKAGDLKYGETINIGGEEMRVTDIDKDGVVTLQDGEKFGTQEVHPDESLMIKGETPEPVASKPTTYINGDKAEYTGETRQIAGGTFYVVKFLEGTRAGEEGVTQRGPDGVSPNDAAAKEAWHRQQADARKIAVAEELARAKVHLSNLENRMAYDRKRGITNPEDVKRRGELQQRITELEKPAEPVAPKLRPSDGKGTGELLQGDAAPFNLVAETAADIAKREAREAAEQVAKEAKDAAEAKAKQDKEQGNLFDDDPFTIADTAPATSLPVESVQRAVRVVAGRLAGAMPHEVIADGSQYPQRVKDAFRKKYGASGDLNRIRGVVVGGRIYINAAAIENAREAIETFMHEAAGHGGVDALLKAFGEKATTQLDAMLKRLFPDDYAAVQRSYEPHEQVSETLARLMQRVGPEMSAQTRTRWQRVMDWLRNALNDLGVKRWSTNDVMALLRRGVDAVRKSSAATPDAGAVRMSYAGEKAQVPQFMRDSLDTAKAMAAAGKTSEEIRAVTGWFPGKYDGKMRWEVPDEAVALNEKPELANLRKEVAEATSRFEEVKAKRQGFSPAFNEAQVRMTNAQDKLRRAAGSGDMATLGERLVHPELFALYPAAKNIRLVVEPMQPNYGGYFDPISNKIAINSVHSKEAQLSSLLHEIQHWTQKQENFAEGGDLSQFLYSDDFKLSSEDQNTVDNIDAQIADLRKEERELGEFFRNLPDSMKGVGKAEKESRRLNAISYEVRALNDRRYAITKPARDKMAMDKYRRAAGEIESRDVQARQNFTPEQRKAVEPYSSENIAKKDSIVMSGGGPVQMSTAPARITPEQDREYLAAVKRGDMETAQRMGDKAAIAAGAHTNADGSVQHFIRGGNERGKTVFPGASFWTLDTEAGRKVAEGYRDSAGDFLGRKIPDAERKAKNADIFRMYRELPESLKKGHALAAAMHAHGRGSDVSRYYNESAEQTFERVRQLVIKMAKEERWPHPEITQALTDKDWDKVLRLSEPHVYLAFEANPIGMTNGEVRDQLTSREQKHRYDALTSRANYFAPFKSITRAYLMFKNPLRLNGTGAITPQSVEQARKDGYDAIWSEGAVGGDTLGRDNRIPEVVVLSAEQVKSADPSTIPLSERFNPESSDIRFSLKDENPEATSTKRAFTDAARAARGEEPTGVITKPAIDALKEGALAELARNPDAGRELVREIIGATGQPDITPEKEALLAMHRRTLQNEIEMQSDRAMDERLTPEQREIANERWDDLEQEITELEDATNRTGSAWSNWGRIRMQETLRDFSLAMLTKRARKIKGGEQLTRDERAELKARADKIAALHEQELARRTELANIEREEAAAAAFQQGKAEAAKEAEENQPDPRVTARSQQFINNLRSKVAPAVRRVKGIFDKGIGSKAGGESDVKMSLAPDPEKPAWFSDVALAGSAQMAEKNLSKEKWLASLKVLTGDTEGNLDPYADELWTASNAILDAEISADPEESKRVKATKMKRNASKEQLIEGMAERVAEDGDTSNLGRYLKKLAVKLIESGVDTREALVDAMHDSVKDIDPSLTREAVMDLWSDYGKFRPATTDEVKVKAAQLRGEVQQVRKLMDMEKGLAAKLTGIGRVEPSAEHRKLTKQVEDAKRRGGFTVTDPARQLKTALDAIQARLKNEIADMDYAIATRKPLAEHKNAITYDAQTKALKAQRDAKKAEYEKLFPKDTAAADLAAINRALDRSIAELSEQIKSGDLYPGKQGRRLTSPEIEAKRARIEALRDERTVLRGLDTARVEAAKMAATQARVDELNRQRAAGWPDSPTGTPTVDTPLLAALKAKRDELLKERQASQRPSTDPEMRKIEALDKLIAEKQAKIAAGDTSSKPKSQNVKTAQVTAREAELRRLTVELAKLRNSDIARQLEQLKSRKSRQLADLLEKIAKKDFEPKAKPPEKPTDPELQSIEFQVSQAKGELMEGMAELARSRRTGLEKARDTTADVFHTTRALMTGGEFSGVFRQGKLAALSHPVVTFGQAVPAMFRAFRSVEQEHAEMNKIWARPNAAAYKRSGLALHNPWDFTAAQLEGNYRSRWANKIPFIAGSGRAYTLFLNNLRAGLYDTLSASLSSTEGVLTAGQEKEIANLINKMTGSGNLGMRGQKASEYLNVFFFAPKFVASRFQMITGAVKAAGDVATGFQISKENNAVRKLVAKEYGRMLTGIAVMYALYAAFRGDDEPIETDPRSTKFGKIPMGNGSYVDPMAGLLQVTVFLNTLRTGEVKNKKGEIKSVWMDDDGTSAFGQGDGAFFTRFLRSKMSPAAGTLYDRFVTHKMVDGKPFTYTDAVLNLVTPMTYKDIYEAMRAQGVPKGTILSTLTMFGEGLSTYENDSKPTHARSHRR